MNKVFNFRTMGVAAEFEQDPDVGYNYIAEYRIWETLKQGCGFSLSSGQHAGATDGLAGHDFPLVLCSDLCCRWNSCQAIESADCSPLEEENTMKYPMCHLCGAVRLKCYSLPLCSVKQ